MAGLHAETADLLPLEILGLLIGVLVLDERDALGAIGDGAAEDDQVIALSDIGAGRDGTEGEHVGGAVGERRHCLGETARHGLRGDVELLFLVVALLEGQDDGGDLRVLAQKYDVEVFGVGRNRVVVLAFGGVGFRLGLVLGFLLACTSAESGDACECSCGCRALDEGAARKVVDGLDHAVPPWLVGMFPIKT